MPDAKMQSRYGHAGQKQHQRWIPLEMPLSLMWEEKKYKKWIVSCEIKLTTWRYCMHNLWLGYWYLGVGNINIFQHIPPYSHRLAQFNQGRMFGKASAITHGGENVR